MMKAEEKAKWVAALRSGKFKQAQGILFDSKGGSYCCVGVYAEVVEGFEANGKDYCFPQIIAKYPGGKLCSWKIMLEVAGVPIEEAKTLTTMNDTGSSFEEIADYIEKNL